MDRTKEVTFEIPGTDGPRTLTLRNTVRMWKRFQRAFDTVDDKGITHIGDLVEAQRFLREGSLEHTIAFVWAALQDKHAAEFPTIESVDVLFEQHEAAVSAAFLEVAGLGKIDPKDLEELARQIRGENPPAAQDVAADGTGESPSLPVSPAA